MSSTAIAVSGALGRMGREVIRAVEAEPGATLCGRFDREGAVGEGLVSRDAALTEAQVVIDFTTGAASAALARVAATQALVIGSTGLTPEEEASIARAAGRVAVVRSGNFSLGVNVLLGLVARAAKALGPNGYDIEIIEAHHRRKVDAPSGTALMLGEAAAAARGVRLATVAERVRDGLCGPREPGAIGFAVVRGGGVIGEHEVLFAAEDEVLRLSHTALDRGLFARGAVAAALWAARQPPGLYDMQDVLGLKA